MKKIISVKISNNMTINCEVVNMGKDYALLVYGGDTPHIGSVAMSTIRPSLTGQGKSVTTSVINGIGHKDEQIARLVSEGVALKKECVTVCACGIHIDDISQDVIQEVKENSVKLLEKVLKDL